MSDSITPFGTTRSVFSLATNDLEINGDIIASKFVGSGDKLTNITIKSINESTFNNNYVLDQTLGGTGNRTFIDKGILFNNETYRTLESTENFIWDNVENALFINNKDIIKDYSNYILETAEVITSNIESTSNNVISQIINYIENDIRVYNVNGIPKTSTSNYGLVKVGEGLFVDDNGVITIKPQDIVIQRPDVEPELTPNNIPDTNYERFVFKYDPDRGTTFDNNIGGSRNTVLPYWFNFDSRKINDGSNIQSTGSIQTNALTINNNTDVLIKIAEEQKYEYTPLNNNYLYFNGTENSYAYFDSSIDFYDIFNNVKAIGGSLMGITFSFWFKIEEKVPLKGSLIFLSSITNSYLLEIDIILDKPSDEYNKLSLRIFNLSEFKHILSTNIELYKWYHLVWTIGGNGIWSIHLNNVKETNILYNPRAVIELSSKYVFKNIGRSKTSQTSFKFSLSDLRIYNRVLTEVEITELYCANIYTEYNLKFNDPNYTKCDILLIGGGGGGTNEGGGGAGELVYIDNATIDQKTVNIKVGRGGAGKVIKNIKNVDVIVQENTKGVNTVFGLLNINGGGSYNINLGTGGSGSGNGGISQLTTNFNNFITASGMYHKGNVGYILNGGGGGSHSAGQEINGGAGLNAIKDGATDLFNFKTIFSLSNDNKESYYDEISGSNYFAAGGATIIDNALGGIGGGGGGSHSYNENTIYNGLDNTGSGGGGYFNHGFSGGSGIIILRFLNKEILNTGIKNDIIQTCNYIISLNNSITSKVNNLNTDNIAEYVDNNNKFIVNNVYNNDLLLNGTLTVASDLLVLGNTTTLQSDMYITEKIEITNYDSDAALRINQIGGNIGDRREVMTVLYNFNKLLTVINNGCVGIGTVPHTDGNNLLEVKGNINIVTNYENNHKYTINNRDIIGETSNYILAVSNYLNTDYDRIFDNTTNYLLATSNVIKTDYDTKFANTTNYILATSNQIADKINNLTTDHVANGTYNKYIVAGIYEGDIEVKGHFITSNITIHGEKTKLVTDVFSTEVLEISNNGTDTTINVSQLNQSYDILRAYNNVNNVFTILGNGNVGINVENPSSILELKGDINIDGNIIPKISNASNLGSPSNRWNDLYLSGNSIFLDNLVLSKNNSNLDIKDDLGNYKNININTIELNNGDKKVSISIDTAGNIKYTLNNEQILYPSISTNLNDSTNIITADYITNTSNNILDIIRNINTDDILTLDNAENKYIRNNAYNSNLLINGDIIINSNLHVYGSNIIEGNLKTQNIIIENNLLEKAFSIKQYSSERILSISNINSEVFTIINDGKVGINNENPEYSLDIGGNINASAFLRNGQPLSLEISQGMIIQTKHLTYSKTEYKTGNDWEPINNNIANGFVISIKPSDSTSKILISIVCHIGMEYLTDSRWWGLRLYRKIGSGSWEHISNANGIIENNSYGTSCWISHNLGAESSTYSHFITNVTGSYQDMPNTTETVYYTAYWKNKTNNIASSSLYLNKSSLMLDNNYPSPSSSWTATEIWNKGTSYIAPPQTSQIQINTQYNTVGIDTAPPTDTHKLNVGGNINLIQGSYNINGTNIMSSTSNYIEAISNYLINKINELNQKIQVLENA